MLVDLYDDKDPGLDKKVISNLVTYIKILGETVKKIYSPERAKLLNAETDKMFPKLLASVISTAKIDYLGVTYDFIYSSSQIPGTIGAALIAPYPGLENLYKTNKYIIINVSVITSFCKYLLTAINKEHSPENINRLYNEIIMHEIGHHIRGPLLHIVPDDINTLLDIGRLYYEEELRVNELVGADWYSEFINGLDQDTLYMNGVGGGIMSLLTISEEIGAKISTVLEEHIEVVLLHIQPATIIEQVFNVYPTKTNVKIDYKPMYELSKSKTRGEANERVTVVRAEIARVLEEIEKAKEKFIIGDN